jgi:very-short-patch-repair endonuclease
MSLSHSPKLYHVAHERARQLRKHLTPSERTLWQALRGRRLDGYKFLRQHPVLVDDNGRETFVVADFYCAEARLIVEVDGTVHANQQERDRARDLATDLRGYRVMRVKAEDVQGNLLELLARIKREVERYVQAPGT